MKKYARPIYCGISGRKHDNKYEFHVDFDDNSMEDVIQFIEPFFYTSSISHNTYWFGYKYNGKVDQEYRDAFISYMKNVQEEPMLTEENEFDDIEYSPDSLSEYDLNEMIHRSLDGIRLNQYNIQTIVYPRSASNKLVRVIVKCISRYMRNSDRLNYAEIQKADPAEISFDYRRFDSDIENRTLLVPPGVDHNYVESMLDAIHSSESFSLRRDVHPVRLRPYIKDFLVYKGAADKLEDASNILIVDDFATSGTTISEIVSIIRRYNQECNIYIYTLLGNQRLH